MIKFFDTKTPGHQDIQTMYINQILTYLVWPVFILVSWIIIKAAVVLYEKKFAVKEQEKEA
jgi:hypothetical protein